MSDFVTCKCQYCDKGIEFDASAFAKNETRTVLCPHCGLETLIFVPFAPKPAQDNKSPILTIGDIAITKDKVITPNGTGSLADSQWVFSDMSRTETRIPAVAIILAIVFAILCLIGLLFLLMKENNRHGLCRGIRSAAGISTTKFRYRSRAKKELPAFVNW